jgi:short-subunit dehydrogenase
MEKIVMIEKNMHKGGSKINKAIIVGATSGIGEELAVILSNERYELGLTGRRIELLEMVKNKLPSKVTAKYMNVTDTETSVKIMQELLNEMEDVQLIILCAGTGYINEILDWDIEKKTIDTNITGISALLTLSFNYFVVKGKGHLCAISSIASIRGSREAPAYNASKAYLTNYLEGLYYKAYKLNSDIQITDISPGLVDTAMAKGDGLFWVMPVHKAAKQIYAGIKRKKRIVYVTKRWKLIAILFKLLPAKVYRHF